MPPHVATPPEEAISTRSQLHGIDKSYRSLWGYFKQPIRWNVTFLMLITHLMTLWFFITIPYSQKKMTLAWLVLLYGLAIIGVTAGCHRLWTHKSYKAKLPLRILLAAFYRLTNQFSIYNWVRHHRVHHIYSDTDADPHNINRGLFFSQIGWLMIEKSPELLEKGAKVDCSDALKDPVVAFDKKHFYFMALICYYIFPVWVPWYFWNETLYWSIMQNAARFVLTVHGSGLVNSIGHTVGSRPYDKNHPSVQNLAVSLITNGEGWHNYHHAFPWDYKCEELGEYSTNLTTLFIDFFAKIGWAYDLRTPTPEAIWKLAQNKGDGTHESVK